MCTQSARPPPLPVFEVATFVPFPQVYLSHSTITTQKYFIVVFSVPTIFFLVTAYLSLEEAGVRGALACQSM